MIWEPIDLELEVPGIAWDSFISEIESWNLATFKGAGIWVDLTDDEAPEALAHFGFCPLVRGILSGDGATMAFHLASRRVDEKPGSVRLEGSSISLSDLLSSTVRVREERMAVTISRGGEVRFALCGGLPIPVMRIAQAALTKAREAAEISVRRRTG